MREEEMRKPENIEHEVIDRLKNLDVEDFDYNAVDANYADAVLKARNIILDLYYKEKEKNKDMSCDLTETRADNIDESTMLKQIKLKLQEKNIPIETLLAEFERLEDLEDDLTTVYLNGVYDGEKKVENKIKAKIEELKLIADNGANAVRFAMTHDDEVERIQKQKDIRTMVDILQSLLEKE